MSDSAKNMNDTLADAQKKLLRKRLGLEKETKMTPEEIEKAADELFATSDEDEAGSGSDNGVSDNEDETKAETKPKAQVVDDEDEDMVDNRDIATQAVPDFDSDDDFDKSLEDALDSAPEGGTAAASAPAKSASKKTSAANVRKPAVKRKRGQDSEDEDEDEDNAISLSDSDEEAVKVEEVQPTSKSKAKSKAVSKSKKDTERTIEVPSKYRFGPNRRYVVPKHLRGTDKEAKYKRKVVRGEIKGVTVKGYTAMANKARADSRASSDDSDDETKTPGAETKTTPKKSAKSVKRPRLAASSRAAMLTMPGASDVREDENYIDACVRKFKRDDAVIIPFTAPSMGDVAAFEKFMTEFHGLGQDAKWRGGADGMVNDPLTKHMLARTNVSAALFAAMREFLTAFKAKFLKSAMWTMQMYGATAFAFPKGASVRARKVYKDAKYPSGVRDTPRIGFNVVWNLGRVPASFRLRVRDGTVVNATLPQYHLLVTRYNVPVGHPAHVPILNELLVKAVFGLRDMKSKGTFTDATALSNWMVCGPEHPLSWGARETFTSDDRSKAAQEYKCANKAWDQGLFEVFDVSAIPTVWPGITTKEQAIAFGMPDDWKYVQGTNARLLVPQYV